MKSNAVTALLLVLLLGSCSALLLVCGKSGKARHDPTPDLKGTYCEKLAKLPRAHPRGPLPGDATLARWTTAMESALEPLLAQDALESNHSRHNPMSGPDEACNKELAEKLKVTLPEKQPILQQYGVETEDCRSLDKFLGHFPDNERLRRALTAIYRCCVEDNFSSIDGELDKNEAFLRFTASVFPERLGIDFELLTELDWTVRVDTTFVWSETAFGRTSLDLGPTGNALKVVRDIARTRPDLPWLLLPTAEKWAMSSKLPSHRRARWRALVAYIEAGAPDPGESPDQERQLSHAIERGPLESARWALAFIPNELEEHVPRPYPYVKDPELIRAVIARVKSLELEEDIVLGLDAVSRMPPGTALEWAARYVGWPTKGVAKAAISAIHRQVEQLPNDADAKEMAAKDPRDFDDDKPRRKNMAKLLEPIQATLIEKLKSRICTDDEAFRLVLGADDKHIDSDFVACLGPHPMPTDGALQMILTPCVHRREYGWQLTAKALERAAAPGEAGAFTLRVASACRTGVDH